MVKSGHCKGSGFYLCCGKEYQLALSDLEVVKFCVSAVVCCVRLI